MSYIYIYELENGQEYTSIGSFKSLTRAFNAAIYTSSQRNAKLKEVRVNKWKEGVHDE